jgi:hypothetical protein
MKTSVLKFEKELFPFNRCCIIEFVSFLLLIFELSEVVLFSAFDMFNTSLSKFD